MKRSLLLTIMLVSLMGLQGNAYAQIFSAVSPSGHTLYYKIISPSSRLVELSNPNNSDGWVDGWENYSAPYGNVVVPQTVTFNNVTWTVRRVGRNAFSHCPTIKRVTLPEGIDSIKSYAFFDTQIDSVNIPSSVVYIGSSNFQSPRLHHVTLPVGLQYIDPWEHRGDSIMDFTIPDGNPYYRTIDGCLVRTENGYTDLVAYPRGRINGTMEIPEGVNRIGWEIMDHLWYYDTLRLVFPSTITRIEPTWFGFNHVDTIVCRSLTPPQLLLGGVEQQYIRPIRLEVPCGSQLLYNSSIWVMIAGSYGTVTSYLPIGNQSQTIEYGESYPWGNRVLTERGVYEDTVQSVLEGCDSMHRVLTLNVVRRSSVDVTIAEGGIHNGHTLAGVYQDTVPTANYDSIVRSRISMTVNRPIDDCTVQLGGNMASYYYNGMVIGGNGASIEVPPAESRQVFMNKALTFDFDFVSNGENLIPNGDFEQGNTGFTTEYNYDATTTNASYSYGVYNVRQDFGVNGSYGMGFDASQNPILLYGTTVPNIGGCVYRLTFMARTENTPPHFVVKVNGVQIDDIDYGPENQDWNTYEHYFYADGSNIDLQIFNVNLATESGVDFYLDNISLEYMPVDPNDIDTITITNTHGMVRNTVDVTINEGGSYRGHTLAGVYQDTIIGANTDSIVRSRISMTVNRPMNNCTVQLGGNVSGYCYTDGMDRPVMASEGLSTQVAPMETKQVLYGLVPGVNLLENGDFEQGNTGFSNDYTYVECGQPFCGYDWYNIMQGYGVDGSYGMAVDGAGPDHDFLRYEITLPNNANSTYKFSYMVMNSRYWNDENPPYIAIKVNGVQVGDTDYVPLEETWMTYEHTFTTDGGNIVIQLQDLNSDSYGNNFYVDNVRLESISVDATDIDTITVTNTHGMVRDTVDVTIAEGGSYRGHTLAGVYQDTIIGTNADSIVRSRISMNVNRPMDNCTVQLGGNQGGTYFTESEYYPAGTAVQVPPAVDKTLLYTTATLGENILTFSDEDYTGYEAYLGDYLTPDGCSNWAPNWGERGVDGSFGNYFSGTCSADQAFFRVTLNTQPGEKYLFRYMAAAVGNPDRPILSLRVNGVQMSHIDTLENCCMEPTWGTFDHLITATGDTTTIELVDLRVTNPNVGGNEWFMDNYRLYKVYSTHSDAITITNTHGMVYDTVDVTIAEGGSYRSHTLAGVYCDTIISTNADSIVRSRISMNVNRTMNNCTVQLGGNQGGTYFTENEYYPAGTEISVEPAESKTIQYTPDILGENLLAISDMEGEDATYISLYAGDYAANPGGVGTEEIYGWGGRGANGSTGLFFIGSTDTTKAFFRTSLSSNAGDRFSFRFMVTATGNNMDPNHRAILALKVNGELMYPIDSLGNCIEPTWGAFEHIIEATSDITTIELVNLHAFTGEGGDNQWFMDNFSLTKLFSTNSEAITITNTHGMVYDTVDVTIAEGQSYRNHTLAGVYQDTILGADADSIIHSRVSMIVNRPMDNCMVQLGGNIDGYFFGDLSRVGQLSDDISLQVLPGQNKQVIFTAVNSVNDNSGILSSTNFFFGNGSNLIPNGDFEHGNTGFTTDYTYTNDCNYAGCGNETYSIQQGFGVDGSYGMGVDGAVVDKLLYEVTIPNAPGLICKFSYMARTENHPSPYFAVLVNGVQIDSIDYVPNNNDWVTFEHIFTSGSSSIVLQLYNRNLEGGGNDFFMDNFRLEGMLMEGVAVDTITITNTHGLVRDTVDVTIAEGGSYRGYTLAGVYQDTIISTNADSIVRSRISMNVHRPMDNCTVQLGGNLGGTYFSENEYYTTGTEISVEPAESKTLQYTPDVLGENLLALGDMEEGNHGGIYRSLYAGDYLTAPIAGIEGFEDRGVNNSRCLWFRGTTDTGKAFFRTILSTVAGERYYFHFNAANGHPTHAVLALKVNGAVRYPADTLINGVDNYYNLGYLIEASSDTTTIELENLQTELDPYLGEGMYEIEWYIDNMSLTKVFSPTSEAITITNTHQMVYDTVDVTIAEGDSYCGYTLAGVYQDTILGAYADSIVRSRISMTVNRPMDNCTVQLGGNLWGGYMVAGGESVQVLPGESVQVMFVKYDSPAVEFVGNGDNLIANGDFEQGNTGFTTEYGYGSGCGGAGCGYGIYTIQQGYGVDGSIGMSADASENPILLWGTTVPTVPGNIYKFTFMARTENMPPPYFAVKVNGEQIGDIEYAPEDYNWHTFERLFFATSNSIDLQLYNLNPETGSGVDFYMDNFRLESMTTNDDNINTITITNTHGMVIDTVDVTIAEGGSYRSHTLAGVYCDTIIGAATDSIVYARVSMDINYTFGAGTASVTTNQEGRLWMGLDDEVLTTEPGFTVQLQPQEERRYVLTFIADNSNMQPNSDFESYSSNWSSDYAWSEVPFQGSHYINVCDTCGRSGNGLAVKGSELQNRFFYTGEWANLVEGHRYSFSYWAKSRTADNPAMLSVYVNDQQTEWMLPDTDNLNEAIGQWKHYEHTFTARRTYTSLMRIMDLNTSNIGNEFFLDDVSLIDLTEAEDAHRDTIILHNTHGLHIATVDVTINEGESHIGHTLAGVYNDTLVMADYDSITHSRVSYIMNVSGAGFSSLENNVDGIWVDIDNNAFVEGDSIGVYSMESRHFGLLAPVSDTNLIANGDFEQGNTGFTSYFLHRPEPYDLGDGTYYIGGYRINEMDGNHYIYAFNYWEPRNGPLYVTTATVEPNTWYMISYRGVSNMLRGDVTVHPYGNDNTVKINNQLIGLDTLTYSGSMDMTQAETFTHYFYNNSETTVSIEINTNFGEIYNLAYDDITLTPLMIIDTVTITNRHQLVYNTVDITLNEGESYNGHTLAGVYNDTTFFADYDSITRSRISMVINSLDGYVQLSSNQHGWWINLNTDTVLLSSQVIANVPPMQSYQYMLDGHATTSNLLVNGDFEHGNTGFTSQYNYSEGCFGCGPGNYFVSSDHGVDNSGCLSVDGAEEYGKIAYEQAVTAVAGRIYRFRYMATTNGTDNSNPSWFEVLVNGTAIGNWDHISTNYPNWTSFEHVFIAPSNSLTIQIIDRNLEYNGNDFLLDNLELVIVGDDSTLLDTITITNIHQLVYDTVSANICQGETFIYDNTGFTETGTYDLPMLHSIDTTVYRTVVLDMHDIYYTQLHVDLCEGDSYIFGNDNLMQAGMYLDSLSSVWGCDSIVALDLTLHYVYNETTVDTACNSHYWNGEWRTVSGDYLYNHYAANGCPQVDTLHLTVNYSNSSYNEVEACDSMTWNGVTYTASEVIDYQTTNAAGCDSVATLNLTVKYSTTSESEAVACDSYTWNGVTYNASDELVYQSTNVVGCDSTATLYLTVNHSYQHTDTVNTCDNMLPFIYNEQPFSVAGNYTVELQSVEGCDSTIALTLNIGSTYSHTDELTICQSAMPYYYGPRTFVLEDTTDTYSIPFSSMNGCDSIISLDLTVHESEVTEIYVVTVQGTNNLVLWHKDAAVDHYNIYRESSTSGVYSLVAEVPYSDEPEWLDTESDARAHSYRYRMTSIDSCGTESDHGIIHKTMHLTINKGQNNSWNLVWTEYEGTNYSTYLIYRGHSYNSLQMIGEIPSNNTTFTDNNAPNGNVYYQIVVLLSPDGTKDGNDGTIRSNVATNETEGIYDGIEVGANIYTIDGDIVVETMMGENLRVMDVSGRVLYKSISTGSDLFTMPSSGVYFVQVGTNQARRVVVVK